MSAVTKCWSNPASGDVWVLVPELEPTVRGEAFDTREALSAQHRTTKLIAGTAIEMRISA